MMNLILRILTILFAVFMIVFGVIWTISPIPFGFVFIILGILLFAATAPGLLRWMRRRLRWLDRLQNVLPRWLARPLRKSDPHEG